MPGKRQIPTLEEHARAKIARYLPDAIDTAIQSYRVFYGNGLEEGAKGFSAYHSACKTAIAHIELLLKLASWAQLPRADDGDLSILMADAQAELDRYREEEGDE